MSSPTTNASAFTSSLRAAASARRALVSRAATRVSATRRSRARGYEDAFDAFASDRTGLIPRGSGGRLIGNGARGEGRARARGSRIARAGADDDVDWSEEMEEGDGEFVVEAFDTADELADALCLEVEENARGCLEERGAFHMAIPGGSVAKALKGLADVEDIDWERVHVFFVNERPMEQKCAKLAAATWTKACGIPDENVHCVMQTEDMAAAAADYEEQMRSLDSLPIDEENGLPVFDLILLGMGADGHVGSVYPNSAAALDESGSAVLAVDMPGKQSVTMSIPLINTADRVVLAATGAEKAETVRASLEDELEWGEIPGSMVDAFSTIWFLDLGAASKLSAYDSMDMDGSDSD